MMHYCYCYYAAAVVGCAALMLLLVAVVVHSYCYYYCYYHGPNLINRIKKQQIEEKPLRNDVVAHATCYVQHEHAWKQLFTHTHTHSAYVIRLLA
jgi:hypothetical protein